MSYYLPAKSSRVHKPYDRKRVRRDLHDARQVSLRLSAAVRRVKLAGS